MIPTLQFTPFTPAEDENQAIHPDTLENAAQLFRVKGCLVLENIFSPDFITGLHASYLERYRDYFREATFEDALTVGEQRYKITVAFQPPFDTPLLYANPLILPIIKQLLGQETILGSYVSVTSLPGSLEQHLHRDHPWLFGTVLDRMVPSYAIKLIVPLIKLDEMSGTTRLWPGSQVVFDEKALKMDFVEPHLSLGDCLLMDYRLLHQGTVNRSEQVRPVLFIGYTRPWFRDYENFKKQSRLQISRQAYKSIPAAHRSLFSWLARNSDEGNLYEP